MARTHYFPADQVHFTWDEGNEPVLTVESGDTVVVHTRDVSDNQITPESTTADIDRLDWDRVYPLAGPIAVEGAEPGDVLAVEVLDLHTEGWGWTADTRSFVEPTSRVLIAARRVAPSDREVLAEGKRLLETWQCADNGWNHGVATVLGDHLTGYAQTTAVALIALKHERSERFVARGLGFLRDRWSREAGRMTVAQARIAFRLHGEAGQAAATSNALERIAHRAGSASTVALAWSALATGPDQLLAPLRGRA